MYVTIGTSEARVGETVTVDVKANAKEVAAFKYRFTYDTAALQCTGAEVKGFVANMNEKAAVIKDGEIWLTALALNPVTAEEEVILTLTFTILDASADTNVLSQNYKMVVDQNYNEMTVEVVDGAVNVIRKGDGNVNLDNVVNTFDAFMLYAYTSGKNNNLTAEQLAHGDVAEPIGDVNMMDAFLLYAYTSGARDSL